MSTADAEMPDGDADPEVEPDAEPEEDEGPLEDVSLDLFDLVRSSRNAHGLRHGDYLRYRQYCSRRLLRLRRLRSSLARPPYTPPPPRMARDPKHLMLPLFLPTAVRDAGQAREHGAGAAAALPPAAAAQQGGEVEPVLEASPARARRQADGHEAEAYSASFPGNFPRALHSAGARPAQALAHDLHRALARLRRRAGPPVLADGRGGGAVVPTAT